MHTLKSLADDPIRRTQLVEAIAKLVDAEVKSKKGASGLAIRAGYKAVSMLRGGRMVPHAVHALLDDFALALDPLLQDHRQQPGSSGFASFLTTHEHRASEALLKVTDQRIQRANNRLIEKTYRKLRPTAGRHVVAALPALGTLVDRFVG